VSSPDLDNHCQTQYVQGHGKGQIDTPAEQKNRQPDRRANYLEHDVGRDFEKAIRWKEQSDGGVVLQASEIEVGVESCDSCIAAGTVGVSDKWD
jgi:hypothetical protein